MLSGDSPVVKTLSISIVECVDVLSTLSKVFDDSCVFVLIIVRYTLLEIVRE